jgi:hypothetical protein
MNRVLTAFSNNKLGPAIDFRLSFDVGSRTTLISMLRSASHAGFTATDWIVMHQMRPKYARQSKLSLGPVHTNFV